MARSSKAGLDSSKEGLRNAATPWTMLAAENPFCASVDHDTQDDIPGPQWDEEASADVMVEGSAFVIPGLGAVDDLPRPAASVTSDAPSSPGSNSEAEELRVKVAQLEQELATFRQVNRELTRQKSDLELKVVKLSQGLSRRRSSSSRGGRERSSSVPATAQPLCPTEEDSGGPPLPPSPDSAAQPVHQSARVRASRMVLDAEELLPPLPEPVGQLSPSASIMAAVPFRLGPVTLSGSIGYANASGTRGTESSCRSAASSSSSPWPSVEDDVAQKTEDVFLGTPSPPAESRQVPLCSLSGFAGSGFTSLNRNNSPRRPVATKLPFQADESIVETGKQPLSVPPEVLPGLLNLVTGIYTQLMMGSKCTGLDMLAKEERHVEIDLSGEFPPERREAQVDLWRQAQACQSL